MKPIQYKIITTWEPEPHEYTLNDIGKNGWVLCHMEGISKVRDDESLGRVYGWILIFYRELP